jgi:hypothetical protein
MISEFPWRIAENSIKGFRANWEVIHGGAYVGLLFNVDPYVSDLAFSTAYMEGKPFAEIFDLSFYVLGP